MKTKHLSSRGFTIIELLIATVIFSVVLLVITAAIVQFGRLYYKGVIQSRTQETARAISQDIAQTIQFSRADPRGTTSTSDGVFCIGDRRYTFVLNKQLGTGGEKSPHVLVVDRESGCRTSNGYTMGDSDLGNPVEDKELVGENMQLINLDIRETPATGSGLWKITVHVAYGESNDLLDDRTGCKPIILGGQFCAVSQLTTTVTKRVN